MISAGVQAVRVINHVLGKAGTGTPQIVVQFENEQGEKISWYGFLSDKALERTVASLEVLGWNPTEHDGRIESLNGTGILIDNEAEVVVEYETYNGETRPKVKWVNAPGGGLGKAMDDQEAKQFGATLRQKILSAPRPQASAKPGTARPAGVGAGKPLSEPDDDLPF